MQFENYCVLTFIMYTAAPSKTFRHKNLQSPYHGTVLTFHSVTGLLLAQSLLSVCSVCFHFISVNTESKVENDHHNKPQWALETSDPLTLIRLAKHC